MADVVSDRPGEIQWPEYAVPELGFETADAQHIVAAIDRLTEQQKIANLIALAEHASKRFENYAGEAGGMGTLFSYGENEGSNIRVRDEIATALGIRSN